MNISHLSFHNVCDLHQNGTLLFQNSLNTTCSIRLKSIISLAFKVEPNTLSTLIFDAIESSIQIGFI
jgi:hypothetical protein